MGAAGMSYRQVRFDIKDDFTEVYVLLEAHGDCPIGVQGWHYKVFGKDLPIDAVMRKMFTEGDDPVLWPQKAPDAIGTDYRR